MRLHKTYEVASFKALPDEGGQTGRFEAIVSVFNNVDLQQDRVLPGAFTKSLAKWSASGDPIPVIWSHDWADPFAHIGFVDPKDAEEVSAKGGIPGGLLVRGQIDMDKPFARQVYDLMKARRVREFSFAYDVVDEEMADDGANNLKELDLIEVGPTLKGANPNTVSLNVKKDEDFVKRELAKAAADAKTLQAAMVIDPDIAKMLAKHEGDPEPEPHIAEPHYRIEPRIVFNGSSYDLEQPEKYVCVHEGKECGQFHETETAAAAHIALLKDPTPARETLERVKQEAAALGLDEPDTEEIAEVLETELKSEELGPRWRVERRIPFTGKAYDLEQPDKYVCYNWTQHFECGVFHNTEDEAKSHIAELKENYQVGIDVDTEVQPGDGSGETQEPQTTPPTEGEPPTVPPGAEPDGVKTGTKPWHIEEQDGKYCVVKDSDGEVVACHDTEEEAMAHMRALYANESDADAEGAKSRGAKAGRVIGSKRVSQLTNALVKAVEAWAEEVNGQLEDDIELELAQDEPANEKSVIEDLNAKLDALMKGSTI